MSVVLCASVIKKKEEKRIKEKSCVVASLARQREVVGYTTDEEKLWVILQMKKSCRLYCRRKEVVDYATNEQKPNPINFYFYFFFIFFFDKNISFFIFG